MNASVKKLFVCSLPLLALTIFGVPHSHAADTLQSLIAGAKTEDEITFIAGAQTFGGRKGLADIEAAFNKRFALKSKINFAAGPDMNARAARHITEIKAKPAAKYRPIFFSARSPIKRCCTRKMPSRRSTTPEFSHG